MKGPRSPGPRNSFTGPRSSDPRGRPTRPPEPAAAPARPAAPLVQLPARRPGSLPAVTLMRPWADAIREGRPWVFTDAVQMPSGLAAGDVADLVDTSGAFIARGMVEPESPLAFRVWTTDETVAVDERLLRRRLESAAESRAASVGSNVTGFRLCHGEGDGIPGLQCDLYGTIASLRTDGRLGVAWERRFVDAVKAVAKPTAIVVRNPHVEDSAARVVFGKVAGEVVISEGDRRFWVDVLAGQKTGFFLDQRENRDRIGKMSRGRDVLNLFGYTGGFSVAAALGGARRVVTVDIAKPAVETARRNFELNGLDPAGHGFVAADAFDVLASAAQTPGEFDLIVVDPPSFAPNQKSLDRALRAYGKLAELAFKAVRPGGFVASASCSSHVRMDAFLDLLAKAAVSACVDTTVLTVAGAGPDHPTRLGFPEGSYLKFVLTHVRPR